MLGVRDMSRLALLLAVPVVILSSNFGSRLLLTNDDARFPVMARDVLAHGHWLLPALPDGQPHLAKPPLVVWLIDRKSTRLNSSHLVISYAVFCLKKKNIKHNICKQQT